MLVRDVPSRWLWGSSNFLENHKEIDEETISIAPRLRGVLTDMCCKMARRVKIKQRTLDFHAAMHAAGMRSYHGRNFWYRPDPGNEGLNARYSDNRYVVQLVSQVQAEAKMLGDLAEHEIGTVIDLENYTASSAYGPSRQVTESWGWYERWRMQARCRRASVYLGQVDIAFPNWDRNAYGLNYLPLSVLQWPDPRTYRLKGGSVNPHSRGRPYRFWATWGRPDGVLNPRFDANHQPLTVSEILEMEIPDDTLHWGLYTDYDHRNAVLGELADAYSVIV